LVTLTFVSSAMADKRTGESRRPFPLGLAAWVLVVTTLPPTLRSGPMALAVYRARWQIEVPGREEVLSCASYTI
jgi:hypothetical protein